jgi:hypothetical protein
MLESRWKEIDFNSWEPRLAQGDENVIREMLIGLFLEKEEIKIEDLLGPLENLQVFNDHLFSKTGSVNSVRCEVYFYIALLNFTLNDNEAFNNYLEKSVKTKIGAYYEYHMANYLLNSNQQ